MFKDLVVKNRSYRGYDESFRFTKEQLLEFVDGARLTPSSVNAQPLRYYVAWEKEKVDVIQAQTRWAMGLPELHLPHDGMYPTAFIIICQDLRISDSLNQYQKDVGIAAQTMLLAAAEQELGGCMIGSFSARGLKAGLELPEYLQPMLVVAFGKPAEKIVLTEAERDGDVRYYRDENDVHYVPKRKLEDIVLF